MRTGREGGRRGGRKTQHQGFKCSHALGSIYAGRKRCDRFYVWKIAYPIERSHDIVKLCVCVCVCVCGGGRGTLISLYITRN